MNPRNLVFSVMLGIRRDRPRCQIEIKVCVLAGPQEVILRFLFHQNRLSGFVAVDGGVIICPFPLISPNQWENGQIDYKNSDN